MLDDIIIDNLLDVGLVNKQIIVGFEIVADNLVENGFVDDGGLVY